LKYYIIAGERSGDLHASNLIKAIKADDSAADFRCMAGEMSQQAGAVLFRHYKELAFMGFYEVFKNLRTISKALKQCKADIIAYNPQVIILIDYAGFNLRIAKFAKPLGFTVFYYISPKIWAWNEGRANTIKKVVDKMFVILPFEKAFYKRFNFDVDFVGNPINDAINEFVPNLNFLQENNINDKPIIAVLPGSRMQEVEQMLYFMVSIIPPYLNDYQFVIAATSNLPKSYYEGFRRHECIKIVYNQTYDLLNNATAALVTSGTATLETALFNVPQVVCYKTSRISYIISKMVIKVKYISLVNLIAGREVVTELIQDNFSPSSLMIELDKLIKNPENRKRILDDYADVRALLGQPGASKKAAELIIQYLNLKK
jgi:lipid-A-disaccharide synthase